MGSRKTLPSQRHCCLSFTLIPLSPQAGYLVCKLFGDKTWLLSACKAAGTWLVLYKQAIIMLSRSRCLEPVLRWKWLSLIWWNTNNVLHTIISIWMLDSSLIKGGLREFITQYINLASQVDVFHTNDYGCQSWSCYHPWQKCHWMQWEADLVLFSQGWLWIFYSPFNTNVTTEVL